MSSHLKKEVLRAFKELHRTRLTVFRGDDRALAAARERINNEFRKNGTVDEDKAIQQMIVYAKEVDTELKTSVIQAEQTAPDRFTLRITKDTRKLDNKPFDPNVEIPRRGKKGKKQVCCQEMVDSEIAK